MAGITRTRDYFLKHAARPAKQKILVAADQWGGATNPTLGANDQYLFDEMKIVDSPEWFIDNSINGIQLDNGQVVEMVKADVTAKIKGWVDGSTALLTSALGWESLNGPITAGAYKSHLVMYKPDGKDFRDWTSAEQTKITTTSATTVWAAGDEYNALYHFAVSEGPVDILARNCMIETVSLSCAQKQPLMIEIGAVGEKTIRDSAKTSSPSWTIGNGRFAQFYSMKDVTVAKIGATYGGLIDAHFTDFKISVTHGIVKDTATTLSGINRAYPYSTGESKLTFDATVFIHDTEQWKTWEQAATSLLVKIVFTKGTENLSIFITNIVLTSVGVEYGNGGSVKLQGTIFAPPSIDPFLADHTGLTLDFATPLYLVVTDAETNNTLHMTTT